MQNNSEAGEDSGLNVLEPPNKAAKLVQIIEDTVQILVDDYELMQDDYGTLAYCRLVCRRRAAERDQRGGNRVRRAEGAGGLQGPGTVPGDDRAGDRGTAEVHHQCHGKPEPVPDPADAPPAADESLGHKGRVRAAAVDRAAHPGGRHPQGAPGQLSPRREALPPRRRHPK